MFKKIGPGIMLAAAGIGGADMLIGIQIGIEFHWYYVLAVILTCLLKYVITEGIARHQIVTGKSVIERWNISTSKWLRFLFLLFLLIWSVSVGAALLSASGLAANTLMPFASIFQWSLIHAFAVCVIIYYGKYQFLENLTKALILLMFLTLIPTAIHLAIFTEAIEGTNVGNPYDSHTLLMSIIGGVSGSVTMLSYSYWMKEKNWTKKDQLKTIRYDLVFSYTIVAFFVLAIMMVSSRLDLHASGVSGSELIFHMAQTIGSVWGPIGEFLFKICFWGVVFSSVITVWSGVPYLFNDFYKGFKQSEKIETSSRSVIYRGFLIFLSLAPLVLTFTQGTLRNVINFSLISSVFVVGICLTLLVLNSKKKLMQELSNTAFTNFLLGLSVLTFIVLLLMKIMNV